VAVAPVLLAGVAVVCVALVVYEAGVMIAP
jgi:hypothetical protein